jgi:hypothetical protein
VQPTVRQQEKIGKKSALTHLHLIPDAFKGAKSSLVHDSTHTFRRLAQTEDSTLFPNARIRVSKLACFGPF